MPSPRNQNAQRRPRLGNGTPPGTIAYASKAVSSLQRNTQHMFRVRARSDGTTSDDECGAYSAPSSALYLPVTLGAPQNLNVEPQMLRKARISWNAVTNATGYVIRASGYVTESGTVSTVEFPVISATQYDIDLDRFLGEATADTFRVKAVSSDDTYDDSAYSETIRIVDSPILRADGDNSDLADNATTGSATVEWDRMSGVTQYTLKHRRLMGIHHRQNGWRPNQFATLTNTGVTVTDSNPSSTDRLTYQKTDLRLGEIYAFQLNYTQNGQKVFSGRDAFVWPSSGFAAEDWRVATYPFFGHWPDKEYTYRICETTFPSANRTAWVNVINHAFEQWETATDDLIAATRDNTSCTVADDSAPLGFLIQVHSNINEVYMVNDTALAFLVLAFTNFIDEPHGICVFNAPACVISKAYGQSAEASTELSNDTSSNNGVDILFAKSRFIYDVDDEEKTLNHKIRIPDTISFNQCLKRNDDGSHINDSIYEYTDDDGNTIRTVNYFPYVTALHEVGHALGTSGAAAVDLVQLIWDEDAQTKRAHPSIPDAVMNYDSLISEVLDEPDCSPHPFDIMAIYALYQTVRDDE